MRSLGWARATRGALTPRQRRKLWRALLRELVATAGAGLSAPLRSRPSLRLPAVPRPDTALSRIAEEAAAEQPPALVGHGYRTWLLGGALAALDGVLLDPELFYVAALLHDAGLTAAVAGEDFTLRSADAVLTVCDRWDPAAPDIPTRLADAVVAHATPGLRRSEDALGYYVQVGALADLTGLRAWRLDPTNLRDVYSLHPRHDVHAEVARCIRCEAEAVPDGRFALLASAGLHRVIRLSPTRRCGPDAPPAKELP